MLECVGSDCRTIQNDMQYSFWISRWSTIVVSFEQRYAYRQVSGWIIYPSFSLAIKFLSSKRLLYALLSSITRGSQISCKLSRRSCLEVRLFANVAALRAAVVATKFKTSCRRAGFNPDKNALTRRSPVSG